MIIQAWDGTQMSDGIKDYTPEPDVREVCALLALAHANGIELDLDGMTIEELREKVKTI